MMNKKLVSICIPTYNSSKYIRDTIQSVLKQSYENIEVLIQDNASTDNTYEIAKEMSERDSRIKVEKNISNIGMAPNWNRVISRVKGEYFILLSADDYILDNFLSETVKFINKYNVGLVTTNHYLLINGEKKKRKIRIKEGIYSNNYSLIMLLNPFSINFTLFKKEIYDYIMQTDKYFFNEKHVTCDYDLWFRIFYHNIKIYYIERELGVYRVHDNNLSKNKIKMLNDTYEVLLLNKEKFVNLIDFIVYKFTLVRLFIRGLFIFKKDAFKFCLEVLKELL